MSKYAQFILALMILVPVLPARALGFKERCELALTTARSKGLRAAFQSWPHLADARSLGVVSDKTHQNPKMLDIFARRVAGHRRRALTPDEYEAAAFEIVADRNSPRPVLEDGLRLARLIPLERPADLLKAARNHPGLAEPSELLLLALNKAIPAKLISGLILQSIHDETRWDSELAFLETPYSARPAPRIIQLNHEGRINDGTLILAFAALFESRRGSVGGIWTNLQLLEDWVKDLYVADKPLPSSELTRPLTKSIRGRLKVMGGSENLKKASFATLTRIETLLGL